MVVCTLGNNCSDTLSPINVACFGCNAAYHAFCIGLPRPAVICLNDYNKVFHYVCNDCKNTTTASVVRRLFRVNEKVEKLIGLVAKSDTKLTTAISQLTSTTDSLVTATTSINTSESEHQLNYTKINKLIESLDTKRTEMEAVVNTSHTLLDKLNEKFSTLINSVSTLESRLDLNIQVSEDVQKSIDNTVQNQCEGLARFIKSSLENSITESLSTIPSLVLSTIKDIREPLHTLRDEIDCLSNDTSILNATRPALPPTAQSIHDELADSTTTRSTDNGNDTNQSIITTQESAELCATIECMALLLTDHSIDVCALYYSLTEDVKLSIVRHRQKTNPRFKLVEIDSNVRPKKLKKRKNKVVKFSIPSEPDYVSQDNVIESSSPGRYVRVPQTISTTISNKNPASRSGTWHLTSSTTQTKVTGNPQVRRPPTAVPTLNSNDSSSPCSTDTLKYIHVTSFNKNTTVAEVRRWAQTKLYREHVTCRLLTPRGTNSSGFNKLSFELGVQASVAQIALSDTFWPAGINAQNFHHKRQERNKRSI